MARKKTSGRKLRIVRFLILFVGSVAICVGLFFLHKFQLTWQSGAIRDRAAVAAKAQDWPIAASLYRNYLKFQPQDAEATAEFAEALEELRKQAPEKIVDLIAAYEKLRQLDSLQDDQRRKLIKHYVTTGGVAAARENLKFLFDAKKEAQSDVELLELAASCEEREGKIAPAVAYLRQSLATGQATPEGYIRLAILLRRDTNNPNADQESEKVLGDLVRAKPNDAKARILRGEYRARQGNTKQAREDVEYAYRTIPGGAENLEVIQSMVAFANSEGDFATAKDVLAKALVKMPKEVRLQLSLADVQIQTRDTEAAKKTLLAASAGEIPLDKTLVDMADRMVDLGLFDAVNAIATRFQKSPTPFVSDFLLARVKLAEGNWPAAMKLFEKTTTEGLARLPVHQVTALIGLADCYSLANDVPKRTRTLEQALRVEPRSLRAKIGLAECYLKAGKKVEAVGIYQQLLPQYPASRAAYCEMKLAEILNQPENERNWANFEETIGPEPHSVELSVVRANAWVQQNKTREAIELLEKTVARPEATYLTGPLVALAYAKSLLNLPAGLAVLEQGEKTIGDKVDFRIARAAFLLRGNPVDLKALAALGENTGSFSQADRYQLNAKLGTIFNSLGQRPQAREFLRKAATENSYDLALRLTLFDLAVQDNDAALQSQILAEIETLDGPGSAIKTLAEVTRELRTIQPGQTGKIEGLRATLQAARSKRDNWGPMEVVLGDLDLLSGKGDAALGHYRRAIELGEDSEPVIRNTVKLLVERQGQLEALDLLNRYSRKANLSTDLLKQLVILRSAYGEDAAQSLAWARAPESLGSKEYRDHLMRAGVLEANGARTEARQAAEKALSLNEQAPESWVTVVRLFITEGKVSEAKATLQRAITTLKPADAQPSSRGGVAFALGTCGELLGDTTQAEKYYREAYELLPEDIPVNRQLHRLLARTNRAPEADAIYEKLISNPKSAPDSKRWARRMLAFGKVIQSGAPADVNAALELMDRNLQEGNNLVEDQRARALILATDPFRQTQAIELLTSSAKTTPLTPDENYYLGRMYMQQAQFDKAELALREATRATAVALPEHLAMLTRVQILRGNAISATETLTKLKTTYANTWEAISEEARVLAFNGNKPSAAKLLLESQLASDAKLVAARVAPFLEEINIPEEAEKIYEQVAESDAPLAFTSLAGFYLRSGRGSEAAELAYKHEAKTPMGVTARLLAGAARVQPVALTPEPLRAKWADDVKRIDDWVAKKIPSNPTNPEILFAKAEMDDIFARYTDEVATYEQLLKLAPENPIYLNNYAMILALANRDGSEKPLGAINRVIAKAGPKAAYLDTRAMVHLAGERYDDAIKDLSIAISLDQKAGYYFHLAIAEERKTGDKGAMRQRDQALREAVRLGLKQASLHPKEWPDYERLVAPLMPK
jgi:cellulose synthase operon protein C